MNHFFFEKEHFNHHLENARESYSTNLPFPHTVIDNFLPEAVAKQLLEEFPGPNYPHFRDANNPRQLNKLAKIQEFGFKGLSPFLRQVLNEFNHSPFIEFLEQLTGIKGLIPDPHFHGGALHQILPKGKLDIHVDFNQNRDRTLDRRINVLLYLNENWDRSFNGELELWEKDLSRCAKRILPIFNRCVIFNTTAQSFHGHPEPLNCPDGITRKSIALYYYTSGRPAIETKQFVGTLWMNKKPSHEFAFNKKRKLKAIAEGILPPILWKFMVEFYYNKILIGISAGQRLLRKQRGNTHN